MATVLDTRRIAKRFKDAGVPEAQTEAFVDAFLELREAGERDLVTKADLRLGLGEQGAKLLREISGVRAETSKEVAALRADLLREIAATRADTIKWMAGMLLAQAGLVTALVRLL